MIVMTKLIKGVNSPVGFSLSSPESGDIGLCSLFTLKTKGLFNSILALFVLLPLAN